MSLGTLVAFFGMTVSCRDARAFHVTNMRMLMTKLSSVTILLQNNLEQPRVIISGLDTMNLIIIIIIVNHYSVVLDPVLLVLLLDGLVP